jgi:hypothetical protein
LDIPQILITILILFQQNMEFCCNVDVIFSKTGISMFKLLCEFVVISKYDEMNCNFDFGFFCIVL